MRIKYTCAAGGLFVSDTPPVFVRNAETILALSFPEKINSVQSVFGGKTWQPRNRKNIVWEVIIPAEEVTDTFTLCVEKADGRKTYLAPIIAVTVDLNKIPDVIELRAECEKLRAQNEELEVELGQVREKAKIIP